MTIYILKHEYACTYDLSYQEEILGYFKDKTTAELQAKALMERSKTFKQDFAVSRIFKVLEITELGTLTEKDLTSLLS